MNESDNPILDACLSEILGGQTPPDLSARILQACRDRQANIALFPALPQAEISEPVAPPIQFQPPISSIEPPVTTVHLSNRSTNHRANRFTNPLALTAAVALVAIGIGVAIQTSQVKPVGKNQVVKQMPEKHSAGAPDTEVPSPKSPPRIPTKVETAPANASPSTAIDKPTKKPVVNDPEQPFGVAKINPETKSATQTVSAQTVASDAEVVAFINATLLAAWKENSVKPTAVATDSEWCRRTFLRLIGRIPTVEELNSFVDNKKSDKRQLLVDQLVNSESYAEEYAANWSSIWSSVLIGRSGGTSEEPQSVRDGLQQFLRQAFHKNKPYNELVYELISASGSNHPGDSDYNGAVNFLVANQNDKATLVTTRVSRVFLGAQLHCAQCHSHPSNDWKQDQFWQLNAFFRQLHIERDRKSGTARLVNRDFDGEGIGTKDGEIYFEQRDGKVKVAYPVFVDGTSLPHSGLVDEVDRRRELAKLVSKSDNLSRAIVNRMWAHFLGFGFTKPIDDIGPHNSPSHPELLQRLAVEFSAHNYDLKKLMHWITLSEPFGLSSKISATNLADMPDAGNQPLFSRYYTRQMQVEELFQSLQMLANARKNGLSPNDKEKAKQVFLGQVTRNMGNDEGGEEHLFHGIPQSLMMMNGDLTQRALSASHESMLGRVAESSLSTEAKIEHLFLGALSRKPNKRELTAAKSVIAASGQASVAGFQDLWWALLNSNEFILDH